MLISEESGGIPDEFVLYPYHTSRSPMAYFPVLLDGLLKAFACCDGGVILG